MSSSCMESLPGWWALSLVSTARGTIEGAAPWPTLPTPALSPRRPLA